MKHIHTFESFLTESYSVNEETMLRNQSLERIMMALDATAIIYRSDSGYSNDVRFFRDLGKYYYANTKNSQKDKWQKSMEVSKEDLESMIGKLLSMGKFYKDEK